MLKAGYILTLDQGTTSCRALLFDHAGKAVRKAQEEFTQHYPQSGWVEQDATEIWQTQYRMMLDVIQGINPQYIAAIGITNQRETTVIWDAKTGKPLHRAIVWQCRRSSQICDDLRASGWEPIIHAKTGLKLDPYFSGTKLKWLFDQHPEWHAKAEKGELRFGTIDSWLIWNLTGGKVHATDYSNASRTILYNIHSLQWDEELLQKLRLPQSILPEVLPSSALYGHSELLGEYTSIPITGVAGDQQAALFGSGCFQTGMAKNTYGTGCFLLKNTGNTPVDSKLGLLTTIAWGINGEVQYALEGSVFAAGAAIQWLRDGLELIKDAEETEALAASVADTDGVYFVPALNGLGAPHWDPYARGMITGISRGTTKAHLVRATLEAIAHQSADLLKLMELESGINLKQLKVDGGAAANNFLMQFQADLLAVPVFRSKVKETTALGAAFLAGLAVGFWSGIEEIAQLWELDQMFNPDKDEQWRETRTAGWDKAITILK